MNKLCAVYKITNTVTGDFYIGSSKNVKRRWAAHKWPSVWKNNPNNPMYLDMQKYGVDKFVFEVIAEVEQDKLKETEQKFIEMMKPSYNSCNAKGIDIERKKETHRKAQKEYQKSDKGKESRRKSQNKYNKSDKYKESKKKYQNQLCFYNGETLTLSALSKRFRRKCIPNPTLEAKKYLI